MRVISGKFKGKKLFSPLGKDVRPTTDRIKETIFNILQNKIDFNSTRVLDLFCGSGALGIEALSRGATDAVFVDLSRESVALTRKNLAHVGVSCIDYINDGEQEGVLARVYNSDYRVALRKVSGQFNLIFLDPPYDKMDNDILITIKSRNILAKGGIIILEHSSKNSLQIDNSGYIMDLRNFSDTSVAFLSQEN